ncbi:MAG: hypothetical protein IJ111_07340 [Eggerthellaceae bacterium]|nr:hypothetical protein [Eggerthellaceae bacterium]
MESKGMNPVVRAVLMAVAVFVICLVIGYVRNALFNGGVFTPNWAEYVIIAIAGGVGSYFGFDAAERRKGKR